MVGDYRTHNIDYVGVKSIDFIDANHGYLLVGYGVAVGSEDVGISRTSNGGASWQRRLLVQNHS